MRSCWPKVPVSPLVNGKGWRVEGQLKQFLAASVRRGEMPPCAALPDSVEDCTVQWTRHRIKDESGSPINLILRGD